MPGERLLFAVELFVNVLRRDMAADGTLKALSYLPECESCLSVSPPETDGARMHPVSSAALSCE